MTADLRSTIAQASPELWRFGRVLTGDATQAHTLLVSTLPTLNWRRLGRSADPASDVRKAMARAYARWPDERRGAMSSSRLEEAFAALSPQERAVTVLRYGEDLSDGDAARALAIKIGAAKNDASRALSRMRAAFTADERPDATTLGHDLHALFSDTARDTATEGLSLEEVSRLAQRASRRHMAVIGGAVVAAAIAVVGVGGLVSAGMDDAPASVTSPSAVPSPTEKARPVLTPDDFAGLAIGMSLEEAEAVDGVVVHAGANTDSCTNQVAIGDLVRGYVQPWPPADPETGAPAGGEVLITAVMYYGTDATTSAGVTVGMRPDDAVDAMTAASGGGVVSTRLGDGLSTILSDYGVNGVQAFGFVVGPGCGGGFTVGAGEWTPWD